MLEQRVGRSTMAEWRQTERQGCTMVVEATHDCLHNNVLMIAIGCRQDAQGTQKEGRVVAEASLIPTHRPLCVLSATMAMYLPPFCLT